MPRVALMGVGLILGRRATPRLVSPVGRGARPAPPGGPRAAHPPRLCNHVIVSPQESLYDAVGGTDGLRRLSQSFYERVLADEVLAPMFATFTPHHVEHVAIWLAEVFGGPTQFTDDLGGHQALLRSHLGLGIRDEHRDRWLQLMREALHEVLPGRPEVHDALMAYFEWGTAIAQQVSQEPVGAELGDPGPTPRWTHHGLVG